MITIHDQRNPPKINNSPQGEIHYIPATVRDQNIDRGCHHKFLQELLAPKDLVTAKILRMPSQQFP